MRTNSWWSVIKNTGAEWSDDKATRLAAALAFYTILSLAPLLVLAVIVAGWFFGEEAARGQIADQLAGIVGKTAGEGIQTVLKHAQEPDQSSRAGDLGLLRGADPLSPCRVYAPVRARAWYADQACARGRASARS